jgi:predicted phage terminase large subunit-like protein
MDMIEVEKYTKIVIPNIESKLSNKKLSTTKKLELYNLYIEVLKMVAPHDFHIFNKYLEIDEDHSNPNKAFYHHRKKHLRELFDALNDMETKDMYDTLLVSLSPRTGKSTANIRFEAFVIGRHPENTQLCVSYSDAITSSFYAGVMEVVLSQRYREIFPDAPIVNQNAKKQEIWLQTVKRYPSISFVPIGGSMTGRSEAGNYLFCDDLVSGLEEALSITRLEKLWQLYTVNCKQRKKDGCKEIAIATKWSVHDPISKLSLIHENDPRCKIINIPCFDENGESRFDFTGGFSTQYYRELQNSMDTMSFNSLYMCEPIEREGLLYHTEDLQYYFELPEERPDSIVAVCDSKNMGTDFVSAPIGYLYGDTVFVDDVVYNNGLPDVTKVLVANKFVEHKVVRADIESNNGGGYYAEMVDELIRNSGGKTSIRTFFSGNNKNVKIITYSDFVKKKFVFKHSSKYSDNSEYGKFMRNVFSWTQVGKNKTDDSVDSLAMLAQMVQELQGNQIKILDRKSLGL